MFIKNLLVISLPYFAFLGSKSVITEWIDLPEFSDKAKVYRVPYPNYERGKLLEGHLMAQKYAFPNSTSYTLKTSETTTKKSFTSIPKLKANITVIEDPKAIIFEEIGESTTVIINAKKNDSEEVDDNDDGFVTDEDESNKSKVENVNTIKDHATESPQLQTSIKNGYFFHYLPIELFEKVHQTLVKTKPMGFKNKLQFLKLFEQTLLDEIELRVISLVNPVRRKRGSGWEDEHMGFPSVEGALLAISFLTFAVYLVQLVMMLFRNLGPNTTTSTVLVNRNKRMANEISEETARILQYVEDFSIKYKSRH